MSVYAIGDIQGCLDELLALLDKLAFDPSRDRVWFTGDLVNRGPKSLEVLRFVRGLGSAALVVLGNHDLHLLAAAHDPARNLKRKDTLDAILGAPDRRELLDWLRQRPLLHRDTGLGYTLLHAGLPPQWELARAQDLAHELESTLRGPAFPEFLDRMYGDEPRRWSERLRGWDRLRFITNCLTRLRYCTAAGELALAEKQPPGLQPPGLIPWFQLPDRKSAGERIVFGHWSTLQLNGPVAPRHEVYPLDDGCLWGRRLVALRLDDGRRFEVPCPAWQKPKDATRAVPARRS